MSGRKALMVAALIAALLATALLAASCGGKSATSTTTPNGTAPQLTGKAEIDNYLNQLDQQMNSVSSDDFNDSQLNDSNLGI
jgi:major membrane immunogen (membrane-anchored lipoprotein)